MTNTAIGTVGGRRVFAGCHFNLNLVLDDKRVVVVDGVVYGRQKDFTTRVTPLGSSDQILRERERERVKCALEYFCSRREMRFEMYTFVLGHSCILGEKVFKSYCGPMLSLLCDLFLFPRGATKCSVIPK